MIKEYNIKGMHCGSCAKKISAHFENHQDILSAQVSKDTDSARLTFSNPIHLTKLNLWLEKLNGKYTIYQNEVSTNQSTATNSWLKTYQPLLTLFFFILITTLSIQYAASEFQLDQWMRHFMAGFFLCFSFFKLLDLNGFATSYTSYDVVAKLWKPWAYIYPFIELGLGLAYLTNCCALYTNITAFSVMSLSLIGVLQSVINKRKIQCACLGAVFNLPMSTVTILEDSLMILMSGFMITQLL